VGAGIQQLAARMAVSRGRGGETLEMRLADAHIQMPDFDPGNAATVDIWNYASKEFAQHASRDAWFVRGTTVRQNKAWETVELPALTANPNISCIFQINASTASVEFLIHGDHRRCGREMVIDQGKAMCKRWQRAGWPRSADTDRDVTTIASRGKEASDSRWLIGGQPAPGTVSTNVYSVEPAPALSGAELSRWVGRHARLVTTFTGPTGKSVLSTRLQNADGRAIGDGHVC
jgi:hypothetical protein